jgi:hypothetical protein
MSKSRKSKQHFMEKGDQVSIMRGIRKPMPPPTKVISPKDANKQKHWDWREAIDNDDPGEYEGYAEGFAD